MGSAFDAGAGVNGAWAWHRLEGAASDQEASERKNHKVRERDA
jgi:hypothetical protein